MDPDNFDFKLKKIFSPNLAPFDYMGYLYKDRAKIKKITIGLGLNLEMAEKAIKTGAQALLVHNSPESLKDKYYKDILRCAKDGRLSIYRAHLPMDFAANGLISKLCNLLGLIAVPAKLKYQNLYISGGVYLFEDQTNFDEIINKLRKIKPASIRVAGKIKKKYRRVAITTGDGCKPEFLIQLKPDAFICGLFNQESERIAKDLGVTIFEATSYATENEPLKIVSKNLEKSLKVLDIEFIDLGNSIQVIYDKLERKL